MASSRSPQAPHVADYLQISWLEPLPAGVGFAAVTPLIAKGSDRRLGRHRRRRAAAKRGSSFANVRVHANCSTAKRAVPASRFSRSGVLQQQNLPCSTSSSAAGRQCQPATARAKEYALDLFRRRETYRRPWVKRTYGDLVITDPGRHLSPTASMRLTRPGNAVST